MPFKIFIYYYYFFIHEMITIDKLKTDPPSAVTSRGLSAFCFYLSAYFAPMMAPGAELSSK